MARMQWCVVCDPREPGRIAEWVTFADYHQPGARRFFSDGVDGAYENTIGADDDDGIGGFCARHLSAAKKLRSLPSVAAVAQLRTAETAAPDRRQRAVDMLCDYLRRAAADGTPAQLITMAHTVLRRHLRNGGAWCDCHLDLAGARLHDLDLHDAHVTSADFTGARFTGSTNFAGATFAAGPGRSIDFSGANFDAREGSVSFYAATFSATGARAATEGSAIGWISFRGARFEAADGAAVEFNAATFRSENSVIDFGGAAFVAGPGGHIRFDNGPRFIAHDHGVIDFDGAGFDAASSGSVFFYHVGVETMTGGRITVRQAHFDAAQGSVIAVETVLLDAADPHSVDLTGTRFDGPGVFRFPHPRQWGRVVFGWDRDPAARPMSLQWAPPPPMPSPRRASPWWRRLRHR